MPTILLKPKS